MQFTFCNINIYTMFYLAKKMQLGWKHTIGVPRFLSHCIVFQGYHVWISTMSLLWKIFTMFLHMMVRQNPHKQMSRKLHFLYFIWCEVKFYLCQKKIHNVLKNASIFKKLLKWF
jgi:hypothetical protein